VRRIQIRQKYMKNKFCQRWLALVIIGAIALISTLAVHTSVNAAQPSTVLVSDSYNFRSRGLGVRREGKEPPETVSNGKTQLRAFRDVLTVEGDKHSWAALVHVLGQQPLQYGGFIMRTLIGSSPSQYWFSCRASGNFLMAWRQRGKDRACGDGLKLISRKSQAKSSFNFGSSETAQANKSLVLAQASDEIIIIPGSQQIILQTFDSGTGITIKVLEGDIRVISTRVPEGKLIKKGEQYIYPQNSITSIDTDSIAQKPEVKDFLKSESWSSPKVPQVIAEAISEHLRGLQVVTPAKECQGNEILTAKACVGDEMEPEEAKLIELINQYRAQNSLSPIPASKSLTLVANRHVRDMAVNIGDLTHGWSNCPYDGNNQSTWPCMWTAPQRLKTAYPGRGYENAYGGSGIASAEGALRGWQDGSYHQEVILNQKIWQRLKWNALGVGLYKGYAVMWVGEEPDPA